LLPSGASGAAGGMTGAGFDEPGAAGEGDDDIDPGSAKSGRSSWRFSSAAADGGVGDFCIGFASRNTPSGFEGVARQMGAAAESLAAAL